MECRDAALLLERYALLLELAGDNPYKARAYTAAAEALARLEGKLSSALESEQIRSIRGIGEGILATLTEIAETGSIAHLAELEQQIPPGVVQLTELRGVGAKKARLLWQQCGITSIEQLERACLEHRIATCKGFSPRSEEALLEAIAFWRSTHGRIQRHKAWRLFHQLRSLLAEQGASEVVAAGELRRGNDVISTLSLVVIADAPEALPVPDGFAPIGHRRFRSISGDITIELLLSTADSAGTALFMATGSEDFIAAALDNRALPPLAREEEVFDYLGLPFIPPELREDSAIVEQARRDGIPPLVTLADMRGVLHVHTTWSDGKNTLEEMALAARSMGFEYIAICDHSQSAAYAGGLQPDRVLQQRAEIAALNERGLGIRILHGIESDILPDGSLDYPDHILAGFDLVVASVHSHFNLSAAEQTARILRAIANPFTTILGHPTGRLLLRRDSYAVDIEAIIAEAARTGTVIEFNVNPYRLDLDWRYHRRACSTGVRLAINPDAHSTEGLEDLADGITVARRGGLPPAAVVNTLPADEFLAMIHQQRHHKHHLLGTP